MAPATKHQDDHDKAVITKMIKVLSDRSYEIVEGSKIAKHGDYFCSICQYTQGCAFGVAIIREGLPVKTIGNIYLETGIMQGFGKPVILFIDKKRNLASDYIRHFAVFFSSRDYLTKYESILDDIGKLPEDLYKQVGEFALKAKDYEKAAKYYEEAYLISPESRTLITIQTIASDLEKEEAIPRAYKQRLLEHIYYFCSKSRRKRHRRSK